MKNLIVYSVFGFLIHARSRILAHAVRIMTRHHCCTMQLLSLLTLCEILFLCHCEELQVYPFRIAGLTAAS